MDYNRAEQETIGLCICLEAVGDIANHAMLKLHDSPKCPGEGSVRFHSHIHQELFLIRLLDFAKEGGDKRLTGVNGSCLDVLKEACNTMSFDIDGSVKELKQAVEELESWLNQKKEVILWLPTIDTNAKISISRLEFLKISGNHLKHNLSRLTAVSREIAKILTEHGYQVLEEQIPLTLDDFREHLSENYFAYYGTWLTELLNNIRWGIQSYLLPTYVGAYKKDPNDEILYLYEYPANIHHDVPRQWFWRLMNNVRTGPYFKKFKAHHYLRLESCLEWQDDEA
jgi:hypothetical protein